jgi:tetratricopeptide (TPR) repeat protein
VNGTGQISIRVLVLCAAVLAVDTASAAGAECGREEKVERSMGESTYATVQAAMELLSKQKSAEAIDKLTKIADSGSDYEKAIVNYNLGVAYNGKNDYLNAIKSFAKAVSTDVLPQNQREQLQFNLGQLHIIAGQFDDGIKVLQEYMRKACGTVTPEAHIFLANALSERKRYPEAIPQIDLAISKVKEPKEQWLQLKLAISYEVKDFKACAEALVLLIGKAPDKAEYWRQLSSVLYEMKDESQSVAVLALAERQGFLQKPNEIKNLYSIYMMLESPYKAGLLLEDAIAKSKLPADEANLGALSDAWINAREVTKAEAALKKLAAMSDKGEYYYKLGAMYGDNERWSESLEMLQKALAKGGLRRTGEVWMRIAVANYGLKDNDGAVAALRMAITFEESRKQASEWLRALSAQAAAQ